MASAYSDVATVETGTSVRNKKKSFYRTQVTTLANGGVLRRHIELMLKEITL